MTFLVEDTTWPWSAIYSLLPPEPIDLIITATITSTSMSLANVLPISNNTNMQWRHFNFFDISSLLSEDNKEGDKAKIFKVFHSVTRLTFRIRVSPQYAHPRETFLSATT